MASLCHDMVNDWKAQNAGNVQVVMILTQAKCLSHLFFSLLFAEVFDVCSLFKSTKDGEKMRPSQKIR